jgi:DNA-binding PadR family transcriptional regulator
MGKTNHVSTLGYAILGLLAREPMSGYRISAGLRRPIGYYWDARHSQVYPELARLEEGGLVTARTSAGRGPRPNKRYSISARGRRALARWVILPASPRPPRDELLLKCFSLWLADPEAAAALIRAQEALHAERLAEYRRMLRQMRAEEGPKLLDPSEPAFGNHATLRRGIGYERELVAWCRWLIGALSVAE